MKTESDLTRFYLVRHGQTEWNVAKRLQGHHDSPLTELGRQQAAETRQLLAEVTFDRAYSSDLLRAQRTAEIIAADRELAVLTSQLLRESAFGPFEGEKLENFNQELRDAIAERDALAEAQRLVFKIHPEVESDDEVATRVLTFMREVAVAYPAETILVVSHAGTIRSTLIKLGFATQAQLPYGAVKNTSFAVIETDGVEFYVKETQGIAVTR